MEQCKICNVKLEILTEYHCATHNLTLDEYRTKYGKEIKNPMRSFKIPKTTYSDADIYNIKKIDRVKAAGREMRKIDKTRRGAV